ncbi:MAG: DUF5777 family beta-barrel protein [Bacteroidia bacterium]|nr:DUF5777 family beta-barrel protein [Bacteroidia bacterium]MDW8089002.1 DUF5777 family beta-barrel protein [Bacteroidia bacterium]
MDRSWLSALSQIALCGLVAAQPSEPVIATFKGTRLFQFHTTEALPKKHLEFRVAHRFGNALEGYRNFFGLDAGAMVRLSLGYGVLSWLELGVERSSAGKWWNIYTKIRLLRQSTPKGSPLSLTWLSAAFVTEASDQTRYREPLHRVEYLHQLLVAHKLNWRLSGLVGLSVLHQNMALSPTTPNTWLSGWAGLRFKVLNRLCLFAEAAFPFWRNQSLPHYQLPWSAGLEIETGGHVFQLGFTNSEGISENAILLNRWRGLRAGFNISRIFSGEASW